jgi:hypothetical protein
MLLHNSLQEEEEFGGRGDVEGMLRLSHIIICM